MNHIDIEQKWITANGYSAIVILSHMKELDDIISKYSSPIESKWRCGYVGIPNTHPLYSLDYSDTHPLLKEFVNDNTSIGDRGLIPLLLHAHKVQDDDDTPIPIDVAFNVHGSITYTGIGEHLQSSENLWWFGFDCHHCDDTLAKCTLDYCIEQCEYLASQLKEVERCHLQTLKSNASDVNKPS